MQQCTYWTPIFRIVGLCFGPPKPIAVGTFLERIRKNEATIGDRALALLLGWLFIIRLKGLETKREDIQQPCLPGCLSLAE